MLNIEKYKDEIKAEIEKDKTLGCVVNKLMGNTCDDYPKCNVCYLKVLDWLLQEYKEPILTDEEKEYLKNLIKHFRNYIKYIERETEDFYNGEQLESINIWMEKGDIGNFTIIPIVETSLTFEGMEDKRQYSLEELGL